jgi:hypothetical protein
MGGKTKKCALPHIPHMEGILIPAMAKHKIQDRHPCYTQEGNRGDTAQARVQNAFLLGSHPTRKNKMEEIAKGVWRYWSCNLSIEQFISWMKVLLQHYGAGFTTSKKLQASLQAMQLKIGCRGNTLNEDYEQ